MLFCILQQLFVIQVENMIWCTLGSREYVKTTYPSPKHKGGDTYKLSTIAMFGAKNNCSGAPDDCFINLDYGGLQWEIPKWLWFL